MVVTGLVAHQEVYVEKQRLEDVVSHAVGVFMLKHDEDILRSGGKEIVAGVSPDGEVQVELEPTERQWKGKQEGLQYIPCRTPAHRHRRTRFGNVEIVKAYKGNLEWAGR